MLGHEIAHVEKRHTYNMIRNEILEEEFDRERPGRCEEADDIKGGLCGGWGSDRWSRWRLFRGFDRRRDRRGGRNRRRIIVPESISADGMVRGV